MVERTLTLRRQIYDCQIQYNNNIAKTNIPLYHTVSVCFCVEVTKLFPEGRRERKPAFISPVVLLSVSLLSVFPGVRHAGFGPQSWVRCLFLLVLVNDLILIGQFHILVLHMVAGNCALLSVCDSRVV